MASQASTLLYYSSSLSGWRTSKNGLKTPNDITVSTASPGSKDSQKSRETITKICLQCIEAEFMNVQFL
jgi:hypothetical protein